MSRRKTTTKKSAVPSRKCGPERVQSVHEPDEHRAGGSSSFKFFRR
jgi:hypothetical protein